MHDNARPHKSHFTTNFIETAGLRLLSQPPYSPDMNLQDRFVFRNMENARKDITINNSHDIVEFLNNYVTTLTSAKMKKEMDDLIAHCQNVVQGAGEYV